MKKISFLLFILFLLFMSGCTTKKSLLSDIQNQDDKYSQIIEELLNKN